MFGIALELEKALKCSKTFIMNTYVKNVAIDKVNNDTREALECINDIDDCLQKLLPYVSYYKKLKNQADTFTEREK